MKFLYLVYILVVSSIKCSLAFPFFMTSVGSVPKSIVRYNTNPFRTIPTLQANNQFKTYPRSQTFYDSNNRFDNLMFPEDKYIEQREMTDTQSDESSDLHPIYVLPPPNFQPIIYPTSRSDGVKPEAKVYKNQEYPLKRQIPYEYPYGFSSWLFGGLSGIQKGGYWEQLSSDLALHNPVKAQQPSKRVVVALKRATEPKNEPNWMNFPIFEAKSFIKDSNSIVNKEQNNNEKIIPKEQPVLKTKLPVGLTSFFLGGMRGISGRHWQMPQTLVSQVEFMPNDGKIMTEKEKKKTEYKPTLQFDDDNDFYNVIKLD